MTLGLILLGSCWAGGVSPLAAQSAVGEGWQVERKEFAYEAASLTGLRLVNVHGDIRVRAGEGDRILISAVVQRHADDPRALSPSLSEVEGVLAIEVAFDDSLEAPVDPAWPERRIDLGVLLPESLATSLRTVDGLIEVEGLVADAELETAGGEITIETRGGLIARTETGNVRAQLQRSGWAEPVTLESTRGDLRVELLEGAKASVEFETRGTITTDYSIDIERQSGSILKHGRAEIGGGGQTLRLVSNRGGIRLLAVIVSER